MSDFFESAKNLVNSAVGRTSWEAQKQMRQRGKQGEIDKLVEQRHQLMDELGQVAMTLYQQGALTDTQLSRLCASIFELDHDLRNRETQLQEIKAENYPADQYAPNPTTNYTPPSSGPSASTPPPAGGGYQGGSATGGGYQSGPAATGRGAQPGAAGQGRQCPQCGSLVRPNRLYCSSCGAKVS